MEQRALRVRADSSLYYNERMSMKNLCKQSVYRGWTRTVPPSLPRRSGFRRRAWLPSMPWSYRLSPPTQS